MPQLHFPQDLFRFLYWILFKPLTLKNYVHQIDPSLVKNSSLLSIWKQSDEYPQLRQLVFLICFHTYITPLLGYFIEGIFFTSTGLLPWHGSVYGVVLGILGGTVFELLSDYKFGILMGLAGGISSWIVYGLISYIGTLFGLIFCSVFGLGSGIFFGLLLVDYNTKGRNWVYIILSDIILSLLLSVLSLKYGIVFGIGFAVGFLRLPLYAFQMPLAWVLSHYGTRLWRFSPVNWDEVILFPLLGLDQHLLAISRCDRLAGLEAITKTSSSYRQSWAARSAILQLIGDDLKAATTLKATASIFETLAWLSDETRSKYKSLLLGLEEISRCANAALEGETLYNRQEQLRRALTLVGQVRKGLPLAGETELAAAWTPGLNGLEELFTRELRLLDARETIPNVYVAGSPLAEASKVFKGRADLFRALENELSTPAEQRPALLLFGARRTGKTSVIKQLPIRLGPQIVPVEVDLQSAATAENATGLLKKMAQVIQKACALRHFDVPDISQTHLEKDPYPVFQSWLEEVETILDDHWLLIALDEYEALGIMLDEGRVDERIFQMLRGLVQHHRLMMLFGGAHTLEDLPPLWSNYLVNVKVLKVNALKENEAYELVTKPIPEFNLVYEDNAERLILEATACQPYLIQVVCRELVNSLNEESRLQASHADINQAIDCALTSAIAYFNDLFNGNDSDADQRAVLSALAASKAGQLTAVQLRNRTHLGDDRLQKALHCLVHREVLKSTNMNYQFQVELVRRWVKEKA